MDRRLPSHIRYEIKFFINCLQLARKHEVTVHALNHVVALQLADDFLTLEFAEFDELKEVRFAAQLGHRLTGFLQVEFVIGLAQGIVPPREEVYEAHLFFLSLGPLAGIISH